MPNPVALVTGGNRGIGLGIAQALAAAGFDLAICATQEAAAVAEALAAIRAAGSGTAAHYYRCDLADSSARAALLADLRAHYGRLNVLVNNAGVAPQVRADLLDASEESFERVMRINLQGPYFLTQAMAKWLIEQKQADSAFAGCIINVSSISADVASPNRGEYCLSKAGLSMMTKLFAVRLGAYDLPVYEIRPGIIATDMTAGVKEKYDKLIADGLLLQARWGRPEDIGRAVAMLARGDLAYATGQVINLDGGLTVPRL